MSLKILFTSAEAAPFAKVGGLADVVGSLPKALRNAGLDARVLMPYYGFLRSPRYAIEHLFSFQFTRSTGTTDVHVHTSTYEGVPFYFVSGWPFFGEDSSTYTTWDWDVPRFLFFNQVALAVAWELRQRHGWFPDLFHVHDWHTGLIPFLLHESRHDPIWSKTASMLSIHNLAYQGDHVGGWLWQLGIPGRSHPDLVYQNLTDNLLAISIAYSDILTTVSPRYAIEIQYPYMGYGLDGLIRRRLPDLHGILNGMDIEHADPETDPKLVSNYNANNFREKRPANKRQLQSDSGLQIREDIPVIGMVSRLVEQKGLDLAIPALRRLLADTEVQFIVLGTGDPHISHQIWQLGQDFPWRVRTFLQYDGAVAQRIYAGCDIFLMPSRYEPCGIGQMLAMRYGALPLVRETGGLADTVQNYDNGDADTGTGFVFNWQEPDAVLGTMRWALDVFHNRNQAWQRMQERAMQIDFSWGKSALQYIDLYHKAVQKHT